MKKRLISMMLAVATAVSFTACSGVEANTSRTISVDSSSITESTESTTSTTTDSKADSTTSTTESVTTSESSEPAEDKYEIKITDEKYGEKAYVVEGIKTVVKDGKTYTVGGEFDGGCVIDNVWLPEMRSEYPTGDDFVCWDSITEFFGIYDYVNTDIIIDDIPMSTDFYYDESGQLWGPALTDFYVGDPKTNFDFCAHYGNQIVELTLKIIKAKNLKVKLDTDMAYADYQSDDGSYNGTSCIYDKIMEKEEPIQTFIRTYEGGKVTWKSYSKSWGNFEYCLVNGADYGLIIGVYNSYFLVFIPISQKLIAYEYSNSYNPIIGAISLTTK